MCSALLLYRIDLSWSINYKCPSLYTTHLYVHNIQMMPWIPWIIAATASFASSSSTAPYAHNIRSFRMLVLLPSQPACLSHWGCALWLLLVGCVDVCWREKHLLLNRQADNPGTHVSPSISGDWAHWSSTSCRPAASSCQPGNHPASLPVSLSSLGRYESV